MFIVLFILFYFVCFLLCFVTNRPLTVFFVLNIVTTGAHDVKSDNILMNARDDVKLDDFGCKKIKIVMTNYLTRVIGSVRYYSPAKWLHVVFNMVQNQTFGHLVFQCLKF